jgi:hypothetical protein
MGLIMMGIDNIKRPVYLGTFIIIYVIYALVFLGIIPTTPKIITYLTVFIEVFICIVLILKFHPFRTKYELKEYDGQLIFGSAIIILTNLGFSKLMIHYLDQIKHKIETRFSNGNLLEYKI